MITIILAMVEPIEDEHTWSYPVSELEYLVEKAAEDNQKRKYLLWNGRLYETM